MYALGSQKEALMKATENLHGADAVRALAHAYRRYAMEHRELYQIILSMHRIENKTMESHSFMLPEPFMRVLEDFGLNETEKRHWQRILRSYMSGFIEQEDAGYFRYYSEDREETYRLGIECYIDGLVHRKKGGT